MRFLYKRKLKKKKREEEKIILLTRYTYPKIQHALLSTEVEHRLG